MNHSPLPEEDEKKPVSRMRQLEETARLILLARQLNINQEIQQLRFLQSEQQSQIKEADPPDQTMLTRLVELIRARGLVDRALALPIKIT